MIEITLELCNMTFRCEMYNCQMVEITLSFVIWLWDVRNDSELCYVIMRCDIWFLDARSESQMWVWDMTLELIIILLLLLLLHVVNYCKCGMKWSVTVICEMLLSDVMCGVRCDVCCEMWLWDVTVRCDVCCEMWLWDVRRDWDVMYSVRCECEMWCVVWDLTQHVVSVLGMTLNCIHTEWCPGHDVKLHPHFHCHW